MMNRKNFLKMMIAVVCMAFVTPAYASGEGVQVDLQMSIWDPTTQNGGPRKAPPRPSAVGIPTVFLDGYALYFDEPCNGCTLQILDENEEIVYAVALPNGTTEWELPEFVSGEYKLQIIRGKYCFWGWIEF